MWLNCVVQKVLCSAYFRFKTKIGIFRTDVVSYVINISVQKLAFFGSILYVTIMLSFLHDHYIK